MAIKILFAFYPLYVKWNHGIALLSALCRERGIETELALLYDLDQFRERLAAFSGEFVGFSCVAKMDYLKCVPFVEAAKKAGKTVLLGGVWAGLGLPVHPGIDFVCRGDGESLPDFLLDGDDLLFRGKSIHFDMDGLPLPDYELFEGTPFSRGMPVLSGKKCLPYVSSRGCVHRCTFCQVRHQPKGMRIRRRVGEDLSGLKDRYGPDIFFLGDAQPPYFDRAWRESWGDFHHPFVCYIRADIKPEELQWLIDRGMAGCAFGVESGDEDFRNRVLQKDLTDDELWRTVETLRRHRVDYSPFFMTDLPGESFLVKTKTAKMVNTIGGNPFVWVYDDLKGE